MKFRHGDSLRRQEHQQSSDPMNNTLEPNRFPPPKISRQRVARRRLRSASEICACRRGLISSEMVSNAEGHADYTIRIGTGLVELADDRILSTTTYNGQFPGPLLHLKEGRPVTVDIYNDTDTPEQLHWHGQFLPVDVDGAAEEGTPYIPAHGMRRVTFTPARRVFDFITPIS